MEVLLEGTLTFGTLSSEGVLVIDNATGVLLFWSTSGFVIFTIPDKPISSSLQYEVFGEMSRLRRLLRQ